MEPRKSWDIKGAELFHDLMTLVNLTVEERSALLELHPKAVEAAPAMAESFYERLMAHPETAEYFAGQDLTTRKKTAGDWFAAIFSGQTDEEYIRARLHIGMVHVKVGVPVRYPIAMMDLIMEHGHRVCAGSANPQLAIRAFNKMLNIDIAIFNQAYEDTELQNIAKLVGENELLARRILSQEA